MRKVIVLMGPTGVGKTEASILLARRLRSEIISADSMQIYRGMDIGTAKPTPEQRAAVPHHMIDIVDPAECFSAGRYVQEIVPIIKRLHDLRKTPVIVGGTGLYIRAITRGIFSGPSADLELRDELLGIESESPGSLYAWLSYRDPETARVIEKNDTRRIVRAIEVCVIGQEKISSLRRRLTAPLPFDFIKICLTRERKELYRLIDRRVESMVRSGLIAEVEQIVKISERTALQAIGYKEFLEYFEGKIGRDEAVALVKRNSRRYAKRQFTWFRTEPGVAWVDITGINETEEIFGMIVACLRDNCQELAGELEAVRG